MRKACIFVKEKLEKKRKYVGDHIFEKGGNRKNAVRSDEVQLNVVFGEELTNFH